MAWTTSMAAIRMGTRRSDHRATDVVAVQAPVQMARTAILKHAFTEGYDFVVMHDDDLEVDAGLPGNPIDVCLDTMASRPTAGIVGMVYLREEPRLPTVAMWHPRHHGVERCQAVGGWKQEPFEVAGIGFGWVLIHRDAISALLSRTDGSAIQFRQDRDSTGRPREVGEDFDACELVQRSGLSVWADPRFSTVHWKDRPGALEYTPERWHERCHSDAYPTQVRLEHGGKAGDVELPPGSVVTYRDDMRIEPRDGRPMRPIVIDGITCLDETPEVAG